MSNPGGAPAPEGERLARYLPRLLRPLVRLLIQRGITFPMLADLLRGLYVDVAQHDVLHDPAARTDSRVSMLTGVHRKELRHLRELADGTADAAAREPPPKAALGSLLVARWLGAAPWLDAEGRPRPLPRGAPAGTASFESLVASVTRDVRARTVLDEWLSQGLVRIDAEDRVVLDETAFVPRPGGAEQMFYFARNLHDHIAAAVANVTAHEAAPFLERSVHYDGLSEDAAGELESLARAGAQRLLVEINRAALQLAERSAPGMTRRVNLGIYLFAEDETARSGS
jgi:hypothetical protein